ncbi:phage holin family protein [Vallitalea sp.]|uniref:phage holin family protein n=1 Tax=Vallitalea sp. TaxID=1882829 RepID=UPI0025DC68A7|nr:phage holin family protein [Vallitalea sp.]MCT4688640.1 phage holin family protein [Vallitalea sp.]
MNRICYKYILYVLVFIISPYVFQGVSLDHPSTALIAALVFVLVNTLIKPLLLLVTLPINIISLGLFSLIINTWMIMLMDKMVGGINISGFWLSAIIALIITLLNEVLLDEKRTKRRYRKN